METGERLEAALRREVREETGLEVEILCLLEVFERIMLDDSRRSRVSLRADGLPVPPRRRRLSAPPTMPAAWHGSPKRNSAI